MTLHRGDYMENFKRYQTTEDMENNINWKPKDLRRTSPSKLKERARVALRYAIAPRLYTWIETHILDPYGWTWRQFSEAAVLSVISPKWQHPTHYPNFDYCAAYKGQLDTTGAVAQTPFLDVIPTARDFVAGIAPHLGDERAPSPELRSLRAQARVQHKRVDDAIISVRSCELALDMRSDAAANALAGVVRVSWFGVTHALLAEFGTLTPDRGRPLAVSEVVRQCVVAHFERHGVTALREAQFQVWRSFVAHKTALQDYTLTHAEAFDRMVRQNLATFSDQHVPLWSATQGEHLDAGTQLASQFWPENFTKHFHERWIYHPSQR